jgi:nucleotide-binding universal stress UspA family protein
MKILVATDFSPPARSAAQSAVRLARKLGDTVALARVIEPPAMLYPELQATSMEVVTNALRDATVAQMRELRGQLAAEGVTVEEQILVGMAEPALSAYAGEIGARLIVMGTHGRHGAARMLLGSVAERTVLGAPCPVLVVREQETTFAEWVAGTRALRVLVGVDTSQATRAALSFVGDLRAVGPCDVVLAHHYWPPQEYARLGLREPRDAFAPDPEIAAVLERELRAALPPPSGDGRVIWRVRPAWGRPGEALGEEADAEAADLVLVGTRQPHGWDRLRGGSAALDTLRATHVPVLCIPAKAKAAEVASTAQIPRLRTVLAATDFSEAGNAAVPHAYALLRGAGGTVELVHVRERVLPYPAYAYAPEADRLTPEERTELEGRLRALVPEEARCLGITTHVTVVEGGAAGEAIVQAANRLGADAVCVGSHGRSGLARALLGSVAARVLERAGKPVYVVHAHAG